MAVIGFNFKRLHAEKQRPTGAKIKVASSIVLQDVKEAKVNIGSAKQKGLECTFTFRVDYGDLGKVEVDSVVVYIGDEAQIGAAVAQWKKENKLHEEIFPEVYNNVLSKSTIQALILEKEMSLPPHIKMPHVEKKGQ